MFLLYIMPGWRSNSDLYRKKAQENQAIKNQNVAKKIAFNLDQRRKQLGQPSWRADPEAYKRWVAANKSN